MVEIAGRTGRTYHTLDGMRGLAAIAVVMHHGNGFFFETAHSFIAVDLFFVLSGFVIAEAYGERLRDGRLSTGRFMLMRYVRLWPLYVLGIIIGLSHVYLTQVGGSPQTSAAKFWTIVPFLLLLIPTASKFGSWYPGNYAAWSLLYELVINACYAPVARWLRPWHLVVIAVVTAPLIVAATYSPKGLADGYSKATIWVGLARVFYSFSIGLLIHAYRDRLPRAGIPSIALLVLLGIVLVVPLPVRLLLPFEAAYVLVVLPLLVAAAVQVEPGKRWQSAMTFLGVTSYAIYAIHVPLLTWLAASGAVPASLWSGLLVMPALLLCAWLADRYYDIPLRRYLTAKLGLRRSRA